MPITSAPASKEDKTLATIFAHLIGHELAASLAFCALILVSYMPVALMKFLASVGMVELESFVSPVETSVIVLGLTLFSVVYLTGFAVFVAELWVWASKKLKCVLTKD